MAGSVILACEMIEDEVLLALEALGTEERPPIVWVESGLHERPERLQKTLQSLIDQIDEGSQAGMHVALPSVRPGRGPADERREKVSVGPVDEEILALGFCGKGLQGLVAKRLTMVFPRVDDCISLFLNHGCSREEIPRDSRSYYLTGGWFRHENALAQAFEEWTEKYGAERAAKLRAAMFTGYERIGLIDTQAYDVDECFEQSREYAEQLKMEHKVVPGSIQLLEHLFRGERTSEIVVVKPGEPISFMHLFESAQHDENSNGG